MKSMPAADTQEWSGGWRAAMVLALAGLLCTILLGGLSVWFLGSVAIAGLSVAALTFNFHIPAALIRLFAVGRTAAKYGERLVGHKAALQDQIDRRVRLFAAMARDPQMRLSGWQLSDEARLADYLDDVEDLDYGKLRIDLPALTMAAGFSICLAATLVVAPLALIALGVLLAAAFFCGRRILIAGAKAWAAVRMSRTAGARQMGRAIGSVVPLQAEAAWPEIFGDAVEWFSHADRRALGLRRLQAAFDAVAALAGPAMAISVVVAAYASGSRGEALLIPAFLAFSWLAFSEPMHGASRMILAQVRRRAARAELARWNDHARSAELTNPRIAPRSLSLAGLQRLAPDGRKLGVLRNATFRVGHPTVLTGPSGCGKTSLLKQIAGWLGDDAIASESVLLMSKTRQALSCLVPHDAAILADSVRSNLFAPNASDDELWQALTGVELQDRIALAGGLDGWITQDMLSLGEAQRLNLARAWLSDAPIVLLDEPTEHLDTEQAQRILTHLAGRLSDRILVLSSHAPVAVPNAATIDLR